MKPLLCIALAIALAGCGKPEPKANVVLEVKDEPAPIRALELEVAKLQGRVQSQSDMVSVLMDAAHTHKAAIRALQQDAAKLKAQHTNSDSSYTVDNPIPSSTWITPANPPETFSVDWPAVPDKPWSPEMCDQRRSHVSTEYISYCIKAKPEANPWCHVGVSPMPYVGLMRSGNGLYFEVLDCSWKPGPNPRSGGEGVAKR